MSLFKSIQAPFKDPSRRRVAIWCAILLSIMLILVISRTYAAIMLRHRTTVALTPNVQITHATHPKHRQHLVLPGDIKAWHEAPIYARTNGYLKSWQVDIGDVVQKDQLLAVIEAPELDAQLRQAEANLNLVITKSKLAEITAKRWVTLLKTDFVSRQETDNKRYKRNELRASVIAARAKCDHLRELVSFEQVTAPFAGVISARETDIGELINKGSHPNAKPLFRIVQSDPLRLYIKIPETYSSRIKPKMTIEFTLAEHPGKHYQAQLINTAEAINPYTRTLLAEFMVQNQSNNLLPGSYTQVDLRIPQVSESTLLPVNTIIFRKEGLQVATLDAHSRVVLKDIAIAVDYGTYVEVSNGIKAGEQVIINPSDAIYQGQLVHVTQSIQPPPV